MSLLLEALKKAERAKEDAQRRARGEGQAELRSEAEPAAAAAPEEEPKAVLTRAELPDIKQPLEILSDDIAPRRAAQPQHAAAPPETPHEPQSADRAAARKVFEAKIREPNPRLPFYATLGVLGAFALGTIGYFWYQLRPPAPLVTAAPPPRAGNPVQVVAAQPAAAATPAAAPAIPGLPAAPAAVPPAAQPPAPKPAAVAPRPRSDATAPRRKPAPRAVRRTAPPAQAVLQQPASTVSASRLAATPRIHPKVESGYAAYLRGDFASARADYQDALRDDATNRDALLGLAAVDVRTGRLEAAEATYLRRLQNDPNDAHAQAGLIALRGARLDPLATESRVKSMLAARPEANVLHFTLGNQLAQQGRWAEAQQEYFKAFAAHPDNADFAYNLAVSLDHVRQDRLALEYYRRALGLAERHGASFDIAAARRRAAQLER